MTKTLEEECFTEIQEDNLKENKEMVNSPSHYILFTREDGSTYEVIDYIKHVLSKNPDLTPFQGAMLFNVIKYTGRVGSKDEVLQEFKKAQYNLNVLIDELENA